MSLRPPFHSARYDSEGNIILPGQGGQEPAREQPLPEPEYKDHDGIIAWEVTEQDANQPVESVNKTPAFSIRQHLAALQHFTRSTVNEGLEQYRESFEGGKPLLEDLEKETATVLQRMWRFLKQPVWIPGRKKKVREYNRGTLFLIDTVRFGATFAGIFVVLFVALNYQSFWDIAVAKLTPLINSPSLDATDSNGGSALSQQLVKTSDTSQRDDGNLLAYLPDVGPPENLLVIPKLHLNVPVVTPSSDALLRQDWAQVEEDIQHSLQQGVVHYPGTAKPGQAGNFFVTGHSSYYAWDAGKYKSVFARLSDLEPGDEYWIYYNGDKHRYIVRSKKEVSPSDISVLDQPADQRISTLMTCTPIGTTLHRLIVVAQEVDPSTGIALKVGEHSDKPTQKVQLDALPI